jgi:polysaccharide deacetylase 2 family uncharacterized protein YibQ
MGRGIVSGLIWGMLVSVVVLAGVSLNLPLPDRAEDTAPMTMPAPPMPDLPVPPEPALPAATPAPAPAPVAAQAELPAPVVDAEPMPEAVAEAVEPTPAVAPPLAPPPADTVAAPPLQPAPMAIAPAPDVAVADMLDDPASPTQAPAAPIAPAADAGPAAIDPAAPVPPLAEAASPPAVLPVEDAAPAPLPAAAPARVLPQVAPPMPPAPDAMTPPASPALPQIDPVDPPAPPALPEAETPDAEPDAPQPALLRNAVDFTADPDRPLMAIILIDDPDSPLTEAVLGQITFPVSFAIDPGAPDATSRAERLRAAGFEVLILAAAALPPGASASDVEVSLGAAKQSLPQAVAILDSPDSRIQSDRPVLEAVIAALGETGHGMVAFARNLNAAEQGARRAGLAAATAFRLLDDEDQRAPVITRYLDRAAFAAAQEGTVIVVGQSRPDTITAVFSWALGGRAEGVMLAPVSAALTRASR